MKIREWLNQTPWISIAAGTVILACAVFIVLTLRGERHPTPDIWYYDVETGKLFAASARGVPPIAAPSGGEGVRARVYTCGSCLEESQLQVAHIEKYSPEAKAKREALLKQMEAAEPAEQFKIRQQLALSAGEGLQRSAADPVAWRAGGGEPPDISQICGPSKKPRICQPGSKQ